MMIFASRHIIIMILMTSLFSGGALQELFGGSPVSEYDRQKASSATSLEDVKTLAQLLPFLQDSKQSVRQKALLKWKLLPIRMDEKKLATKLLESSDEEIAQHARKRINEIKILQRNDDIRGIVLNEIQSANRIEQIRPYLTAESGILRDFALRQWKRLPPCKEKKEIVRSLMKSDYWHVASVAVERFGCCSNTDDDISELGHIALSEKLDWRTKIAIIKALGKDKKALSDKFLRIILEKSLSKRPKDLKYSYNYPEYYRVSRVAIAKLADSKNRESKKLLEKIVNNESVYMKLRIEALRSIRPLNSIKNVDDLVEDLNSNDRVVCGLAREQLDKLPVNKADKSTLKKLIATSNYWRVARLCVEKLSELTISTQDIQFLVEKATDSNITAPIKRQIISLLITTRNKASEKALCKIVDYCVYRRTAKDIANAYPKRLQAKMSKETAKVLNIKYWNSMSSVAIKHLGQVPSRDSRLILQKIAADNSIDKELRKTAEKGLSEVHNE